MLHPVTSKLEILFFSNNKRRTNSALLSIQNPWLSQTQKDQWLQLNRPHILPTQWQETVLTITCWNTLQAPVFKTCNHSQKTFQIHKPFLILAWLKLMMLLNKQNRFSHPLPRKCHHPPQTQSDDHRDSPNPQHTFIITWLEYEMIHMIKVITEKSCSDQYFSYYFLKWSLLWFCFMYMYVHCYYRSLCIFSLFFTFVLNCFQFILQCINIETRNKFNV